MPLRAQLESEPETLADMRMAAEEKYWEGLELMVAQKWGAGIYLMGFAAEMYLKVAWFLLDGAQPGDDIRTRLDRARRDKNVLAPGIPYESYHSLRFWAAALAYDRHRHTLLAWHNTFARQFHTHVATLYSVWWVEMRYRPDRAGPADGNAVLDSASWLRTNLGSLWR